MTRYNVQNIETGLYYCRGDWASEEPEWMSAQDAHAVAGREDRQRCRNVTRINSAEFSGEEVCE